MAKFLVKSIQDAAVIYEAIVEAANEDEAYEKADDPFARDINWVCSGEFSEYEFSEVMENVEEVEDDYQVEKRTLHALTGPERDTILAALRYYQANGQGDPANRSDAIHEIATNGKSQISLDADAIDALCERINS